MKPDEILAEAASALEGLAAGFVVVGGTAHRVLSRQPQATPVDFEPLATLDIDIVVPTNRAIEGGDLRQALLAKGFEEELVGVGQRAGARYRWRSSPCYLQFLVRRIGSDSVSAGWALSLGGLLAERLSHLAVLLAEPVAVELSTPSGDVSVHVANPASFILQKVLIAKDRARRGADVAAKDCLYVYDTAQMFPPELGVLTGFAAPAWSALTRPERAQVERWIRHLHAGPDGICEQAAFMAMKAARPSPPRPQDLAVVCAEVVSSIRRVALGE